MSKERIGSLFFLVLGVYAFFHAIQLDVGTLAEPGSAVFPVVYSILLIIVGALLFVSAKENGKVRISRESIRQARKPLQIIVLTIFFIFVLERLGYLITAPALPFLVIW